MKSEKMTDAGIDFNRVEFDPFRNEEMN